MASGLQLSKSHSPVPGSADHLAMKHVPYASLLGALLYSGNTTRGDILQAVNRLGRYTANPGKVHWQALKCVLVYLYHPRHRRLVFGANSASFGLNSKYCTPISIYCDAGHGGYIDTAKSTSGLAVFAPVAAPRPPAPRAQSLYFGGFAGPHRAPGTRPNRTVPPN